MIEGLLHISGLKTNLDYEIQCKNNGNPRFFLGICLIVGVGAITYFSVTKLLASVESLSEPNEKLRNLNQLLADIYQLDKSRSVFVEEDTSHNLDYYNQIQNEIKNLKP